MSDAPVFSERVIAGGDYPDTFEEVDTEYLGQRRWGYDQQFILRGSDGRYWSFVVYMPGTENQDFDDNEVVGIEVREEEVTITKWVRV